MARDGDHSTKDDRYARTDEYLGVLRQEWTTETPFDHAGRFYNVVQAFSAVKPDHLPVFFGGSSPAAIDVAGRHADVYALWGETRRAGARGDRHGAGLGGARMAGGRASRSPSAR